MTYRQRFIRSIPPLLLSMTAWAEAMPEPIEGPVRAKVTLVINGDSLRVQAKIWLGLIQDIIVRLDGIEAPEIHGPQCAQEASLARKAKERLTQLARDTVWLKHIRRDKYGGRVIAQVYTEHNANISLILLQEKLAVPYQSA